MQAILRLDLAGQPRGWLTLQEAISAYARGDVVYGIGDSLPPRVWWGAALLWTPLYNHTATDYRRRGPGH